MQLEKQLWCSISQSLELSWFAVTREDQTIEKNDQASATAPSDEQFDTDSDHSVNDDDSCAEQDCTMNNKKLMEYGTFL
jgi:hypothetical protein